MEWLDGIRIIFGTVIMRPSPLDTYIQLAVQSVLTMAAAVLGAWAAEFYHERRARTAERQKKRLLAMSTMLKMSMASSELHSLLRSFFTQVPQGTELRDYWRFVLPAVPIQDTVAHFSPEEFSFLIPKNGNSQLAYQCAEVLNHTKICIAIVNYYSIERRALADMLDQHTVNFDTMTQEVETAIALDDHPNIRRKILETSLLCGQMHSNLTEAITNANQAIESFNRQITSLVDDPAFNQRLVVVDVAA